jgi:excisionase family DNA binding protein
MADRPTPLYVRLAADSATRLDAAVASSGLSKRQIVEDAVRAHLGAPDLATGSPPVREPVPEVLTAAEAAVLLRVDEAAVVGGAASGDLPGQRIGGQWRFGREALLAWLGATPNPAEAPRRA